jgi:hypothetical protein
MKLRMPQLLAVLLVVGFGGCETSPKPTPLAEPSLAVRAQAEQVEAVLGTLFDEMGWTMVRDAGELLPHGHVLYRGRAAGGEAVTVRTAMVGSQAQVRIDLGAASPQPRQAAVDRLRDLFVRQGAKLEDPIEVQEAQPRVSPGPGGG